MVEIIREKLGAEEDCPYLPGQRSQMRYRLIERCSAATYQRLLERGWRRFGTLYFRPICAACQECRSLRIEVDRFVPNRSMRRTWRRNADLEVRIGPPSVSRDHLLLYDRYHAARSDRRGWPLRRAEPFDYYLTFVRGHGELGRELLYFLDGRLVMVALVDVLPRAVSAVYAFYDPELEKRSLGVYSVLRQIAFAREHAIPHVYLGYWVEGNASMRYKATYGPHQILAGRPELDAEPEWQPAAAGPAAAGPTAAGESDILVGMTPRERLESDLKEAMKAQDKERLGTLRMLLSEVKNEKIKLGHEPDADAFVAVVRRAIKQRHDSVEQFRAGGRAELAEKEEREIVVLEAYLPAQASEDDLRAAIRDFVAAEGLAGPKGIGPVMKAMLARFGASADGATINRLAREVLGT